MVRHERIARVLALALLVGLPLLALGYQVALRPRMAQHRVIEIHAEAPEHGGFQPDSIRVEAGETVTLRFYSDDVTHGVAIGPGLGVDLGDIDPGQVREVTLTFDEAGNYTFYCNTWCSRDHWRMRGVVEVVDAGNTGAVPAAHPDPVIERLIAEGVDIDAAFSMDMGTASPEAMPEMPGPDPSPERGGRLLGSLQIPPDLQLLDWRRTHSPEQAVEVLAAANPGVPQQDLVDVVAYLWLSEISAERLSEARALYNKNCAACHGETGSGDGPASDTTAEDPAAFSDTAYLWQRRPDVLYAKIRRGGMGTDMPNFGTVFTTEETWLLVDYLLSMGIGAAEQ